MVTCMGSIFCGCGAERGNLKETDAKARVTVTLFFFSLCIDMFARKIAWGVQWLVNVRDSREGEASLIPVVYSL
ncbi:hypothetical protein NC651_020221 [Populus alba x Populus x berolinensis]|nr:hypothetical protein NC651_020221 [Populus alba x Populus x berolinensis]